MRVVLIFLLSFFHSFCASARYEELLNKPFAERVPQLRRIYEYDLRFGDSAKVFKEINAMRETAMKHNDDDLLLETDLLKVHYFYYRSEFPHELVLKMLYNLSAEGQKKKKAWVVGRAENMLALYYSFDMHEYENACEHFQKMYDVIHDLPAEDFPHKQYSIYLFADFYYKFSEYPTAIRYLQEALDTPPISAETDLNVIMKNTIGLCYQELKMLDSSDYYFQTALKEAKLRRLLEWESIISGNIGHNYILRGHYESAIPFLEKNLDMAIKAKDSALASGAFMDLADVSLRKNDLGAAGDMLQKARQYAYASGQYKRLKVLYPLLSKYYALAGQPRQAVLFLDSSFYVHDSLTKEFSSLQLLRARQKVAREQQLSRLTGLQSDERVKLLQRNISIVVVIFLMGLSFYIYSQLQRKNRSSQRQLQEKEKELGLATDQLQEFTKYISDKNQIIESLQERVGDEQTDAILKLQQQTILTDAEWDYFQRLFEKVHSGYLIRLREKLPGLTPAETRIVALSKLRFSNREMANALGVGQGAIRQHRSRLRKKLNISEEDNLEAIIESI